MDSNRSPADSNELAGRPTRLPDYASENHALVRLVNAQTGPKAALLQEIAQAALSVCHAGSAGISLLEGTGETRVFRWLAVAGLCASLQGKTTAWDECPCSVTLRAGAPQLFIQPQETFPSLRFAGITVAEGVVVPITGNGIQLGAIWVMSHIDARKFDNEDVRLLSNIAVFAGTALTIVDARDSGLENEQRHSEFIAMLGHELRNPMAPIDSGIGAALRLCAADARAREVLTVAQRQVRHLRALVDDLLDAARLEHGKLAIKYSDTTLNDIAFDALTTVGHQVESRRQTLSVNGLDAPIPVRADPVRLSQVLGNILSNAVKYTPVGGHVELTASVEPGTDRSTGTGMVTIVVQDDGIGIDASVQPRVFDLFAQSACGRAKADGGLGIGLAVAKRMVELHDGTISLQSAGPGCGTAVTLRLPILHMEEPRMQSNAPEAAPTAQPVHLLLVDDNNDALISLGLLLRLEGHKVTTASNGRDAIRLATQTRPEVAIVDLAMPDVDGFDVARAIRANPGLDCVTLIALTGYGAQSDKSAALAAGFDYHLTKPLSLEKLQVIFASRTAGT